MSLKFALVVVSLSLGFVLTLYAQDVYVDVFAVDREHSAGSIPESQRIRPTTRISPHTDPQQWPLVVTLESLSAASYVVPTPEPFAFEVSLKNVGSNAISVPTSVDASQFRGNEVDTRWLALGLAYDGISSDLPAIAGDALYGGPNVPGSLVTIAPNATLRLRIRGFWLGRLRSAATIRNVSVRAAVELQVVGQDIHSKLNSSNTVVFELRAQ